MLIFLRILLFLSIVSGVYFILRKVIDEKIIKIHFDKLIKKTQKESEKRELEREKEIALQGTANNDGILCKLDNVINRSGIKILIPSMNANLLIIASITVFIISFCIAWYISFSLMRGLLIGCISIALIISFILVLSFINYARTEKEIITFINLLQNYSRLSTDIISIMGQISPYLNEPLRSATAECCIECRRTGDIEMALESLSKKVNHKKLSIVIENIAICSKYEANYETIIDDSRGILQEFLSGRQQRKAMIRNAIIEISLIIGIGTLLLFMLNSSMEISILHSLLSTQIGNAITIYLIAVILATIILFFRESYSSDN